MEFSRQEDWSGEPFPSPGELADPGMEAGSPALQADCFLSEPPGKSAGKPCTQYDLVHSMNVCAESLQSRLSLCDPMGCSPPGSSVRRILQARVQERVVMPTSRGSF